ncbi:integral membrane protein [Cutibacterium acnes JCM 18918]|nr:integral membrane protein [Cutibacterium acnes JCM 18918]
MSLPALAHPFTRKITGGEDIASGTLAPRLYRRCRHRPLGRSAREKPVN